jgi:hypothetical protein
MIPHFPCRRMRGRRAMRATMTMDKLDIRAIMETANGVVRESG